MSDAVFWQLRSCVTCLPRIKIVKTSFSSRPICSTLLKRYLGKGQEKDTFFFKLQDHFSWQKKVQFYGNPFSLRNFTKNRSNFDLEEDIYNYCSTTVIICEQYLFKHCLSLIKLQKPQHFQTLIYFQHFQLIEIKQKLFLDSSGRLCNSCWFGKRLIRLFPNFCRKWHQHYHLQSW